MKRLFDEDQHAGPGIHLYAHLPVPVYDFGLFLTDEATRASAQTHVRETEHVRMSTIHSAGSHGISGSASAGAPGTPGATVTHLNPPRPAPDVTLRTPQDTPQALSELWMQHAGLTALIMLRHAGCPFCKAQARELREQRADLERAGIQVVLILPEEPATVAQFRDEQQVPFTILADPERETYRALGVKEGSAKEMLNLNTLVEGARAALHGNLPTLRRPNHATQLPGAALVDREGQMHWIQRAAHAADHASSSDLISAAGSVGVRATIA